MEYIQAKTIISKVKYGNSWYGIDYNMNLYRGCPHGCIYCDSRSNCYHIENFDIPKAKQNAINILEKELMRKKEKGVIGIGSMSDTYNPLERQLELTRKALQLISKYGFGVSIDTKSDLILRDLDILKEINNKADVIIKFTITTPKDDLSKLIEPHVCNTSARLKAIKILNDNNLYVGIMINPVLPFITDKEDDIRNLVKLAHNYGAKFISTYMQMTLRENQRDYYYEQLDKSFKGLRQKYECMYKNKYNCITPNYQRLYQVFTNECDKYGILYKMDDIIKAYRLKKKVSNETSQLTLF